MNIANNCKNTVLLSHLHLPKCMQNSYNYNYVVEIIYNIFCFVRKAISDINLPSGNINKNNNVVNKFFGYYFTLFGNFIFRCWL